MRSRPRWARSVTAALLMVSVLVLAACGTAGPTVAQLRRPAAQLCEGTADQLRGVPLPRGPAGARAFLTRGIAAFGGEVGELHALAGTGAFARAVDATGGELDALHLALADLNAGDDPVVVIKTLEQRLRTLAARANAAWLAVRIPACAIR